jgi:hypothetical protein
MVYFANFQHMYFMLDLLSCTTKLDEPRVVIRLLYRTGIARVDGVIHSTDPIFASGYELCCRDVFYTCAFRLLSMRGKDTLHSNGGCPRLDAVYAVA